MDFVPFDATEEEVAARQVLRPGVPDSMRNPGFIRESEFREVVGTLEERALLRVADLLLSRRAGMGVITKALTASWQMPARSTKS
jgi:hypothetical protein